ncbi:MAG: hypothetical protein FJ088_04250 [Deltaproteobacteria bacterium]|nr:hypothetical protein [Deltaproteobacteria bacterium]
MDIKHKLAAVTLVIWISAGGCKGKPDSLPDLSFDTAGEYWDAEDIEPETTEVDEAGAEETGSDDLDFTDLYDPGGNEDVIDIVDTGNDVSDVHDTAMPETEVPDDAVEAFQPPAPVGCVTDVSAGLHNFPCDGISHYVSVPEQCLSAPCGLIVDVHGMTMDGQQEDNNTNMRALGMKHGYIVIQPSAALPSPMSKWDPGPDDEKIHAFMLDAVAAWHVDPARIHFTGFSQGGSMTWRFICSHSDILASAAPGGACAFYGDEGCPFSAGKTPEEKIAILYMHGTKDALIPFYCAEMQREAIIGAWGLWPTATLSSDNEHEWTRYEGAAGEIFEFVEHDYKASSFILQGHCYPGSADDGKAPGQLFSYACTGSSAFKRGEIVMQFFLAHPKK